MNILITGGSGFIGKNRLQEGGEPRESVRVMNRTFWIGVYPGLTTEMLDYVITSLKEFLLKNIEK